MSPKAIRQQYLDFFASKGHLIVPSAPLVPKNDPTLMFINSGMAQFKDFFLGNGAPTASRIADTQKCLRVSGKHNDLEEVGIDTYHHTLFEMLGNWSFGDYFKAEAIPWAWELLTDVFKLSKDRLYVTVFGGDEKDQLPKDDDAFNIWANLIDRDRILYGSKKDNFWEMGDTGPCGPCSEIHVDLRPDSERMALDGKGLVNNDHPQVIEIWNIVFMEFERRANGSLVKLPAKHVDTGMGFERLVRAIEGKSSNYDTEIFGPLIRQMSQISGVPYGKAEHSDIAMRVVADHIRAIAFTIADGQMPSNAKQGYVIRRILRRAVRYGYSVLGLRKPFLCELVPTLAEQFNDVFPELDRQQHFVSKVIMEEEAAFLRTLENGLKRFDTLKSNLKSKVIDGKDVFELYDTFGFPLDLTALIARENNLEIDEEGFKTEMSIQKNRSRAASESEKSDWVWIDEEEESQFVGYDLTECHTQVLRYRKVSDKKSSFYQLVLSQSPFYAESGGQVGDTGVLEFASQKLEIFDTKKENNLSILYAKPTQAFKELVKTPAKAKIDVEKRRLTENNHSGTHLLHAALRRVLGTHVEQKGSLVNPNLLRFDFSHFAKMTDEEIENVESLVNEKIRENIVLQELRSIPIEEAKAMGAMALFGEKYGDMVRTIVFDRNFSVELCGGTHVPATGKIGFFKIISESSVAAGVRRIEAITAQKAEDFVKEQLELLAKAKEALKQPKDLLKAISDLQEEKSALQKEVDRLQAKELLVIKAELLTKVEVKNGLNFIIQKVEVPNIDALKTLSFQLRQQTDNLVSVLASEIDGKVHLALMIADKLVEERSLDASKIIKDLAKEIQGGGGGQKFFATAAGKHTQGLEKALQEAKAIW
ncbi:MAG: alanine--tRNA ligase [Cytophagales bacterium]|nr:MAG: alanine--tRNA ligase [Cytophagales bacterium]TAF62170.1 MAG: alanine--tRNA ligase [Cytophagales bacterium]